MLTSKQIKKIILRHRDIFSPYTFVFSSRDILYIKGSRQWCTCTYDCSLYFIFLFFDEMLWGGSVQNK